MGEFDQFRAAAFLPRLCTSNRVRRRVDTWLRFGSRREPVNVSCCAQRTWTLKLE